MTDVTASTIAIDFDIDDVARTTDHGIRVGDMVIVADANATTSANCFYGNEADHSRGSMVLTCTDYTTWNRYTIKFPGLSTDNLNVHSDGINLNDYARKDSGYDKFVVWARIYEFDGTVKREWTRVTNSVTTNSPSFHSPWATHNSTAYVRKKAAAGGGWHKIHVDIPKYTPTVTTTMGTGQSLPGPGYTGTNASTKYTGGSGAATPDYVEFLVYPAVRGIEQPYSSPPVVTFTETAPGVLYNSNTWTKGADSSTTNAGGNNWAPYGTGPQPATAGDANIIEAHTNET